MMMSDEDSDICYRPATRAAKAHARRTGAYQHNVGCDELIPRMDSPIKPREPMSQAAFKQQAFSTSSMSYRPPIQRDVFASRRD